jgi:hypothetical protein
VKSAGFVVSLSEGEEFFVLVPSAEAWLRLVGTKGKVGWSLSSTSWTSMGGAMVGAVSPSPSVLLGGMGIADADAVASAAFLGGLLSRADNRGCPRR